MHVIPLITPGSWLSGDVDETHQVSGLLSLITSEFSIAVISLNMFEDATAADRSAHFEVRRAAWRARQDRRRDIEDLLTRARGVNPTDWEAMTAIRLDAEIAQLVELAQSGELPDGYKHKLPFIHAKSFLFALDTIRKTFITMKRYNISKDSAAAALLALKEAVPDLAGVRDSTAHADERSVGRNNKGHIPAVPIHDETVEAPNGFIRIGSLYGDKLSYTMTDGQLGYVEISLNTVMTLKGIVQSLLDSLPWREPRNPSVSPSI